MNCPRLRVMAAMYMMSLSVMSADRTYLRGGATDIKPEPDTHTAIAG